MRMMAIAVFGLCVMATASPNGGHTGAAPPNVTRWRQPRLMVSIWYDPVVKAEDFEVSSW